MFVGHNSNRVIPPDQTVTMATAVAHGIDRLEKLFSKKKLGSLRKPKSKSKPSLFPDVPLTRPEDAEERITFPAPSFIRPTTTRMVARQEFSLSPSTSSDPSTRSGSVGQLSKRASAPRLSRRLSVPDSHRSGGASSGRNSIASCAPRVPRRSSSLVSYSRAEHSSLASLIHYEFTVLEGRNAERSLASLWAPPPRTSPSLLGTQFEEAPKDILRDFPLPPREDTPPPSDPEESSSSTTPTSIAPKAGGLPPTTSQPTPGPSPSLLPVPDLLLPSPQIGEGIAPRPLKQRAPSNRHDPPNRPAALHSTSERSADDEEPVSPTGTDPVLQEPAVREFLGLSDDDIAEPHLAPNVSSPADESSEASTRPVTADDVVLPPRTPTSPARKVLRDFDASPQTPPPAMLPPSPRLIRRISARLSVASTDDRAAATAAFEVARIASRYRFDLIYVISLWPQKMLRRNPRPNFASDIFGSSFGASSVTNASSSGSITRASSARMSRDSDAFETTVLSSIDEQEQVGGASSNNGPSSSSLSPTTSGPAAALAAAEGGLNYRFLAAYGLHTVRPPLNIAYGVHSKILKSRGWVEYREPNPQDNEFARGYACSFYTGHAPVEGDLPPSPRRRGSSDSRSSSIEFDCNAEQQAPSSPMSPTSIAAAQSAARGAAGKRATTSGGNRRANDMSKNNRGIVFAAYRKPRAADGSDLAMDKAELREMSRDAEALVDMILDFHMMKRRGEQLEKLRAASVGGSGDTSAGASSSSGCCGVAGTQLNGVRPRTSI